MSPLKQTFLLKHQTVVPFPFCGRTISLVPAIIFLIFSWKHHRIERREGEQNRVFVQQIGMRTTHVYMLEQLHSSNHPLCNVSGQCLPPVTGSQGCRSKWQCCPPDGQCSGSSARDNHSQLHLITLSRMNTGKSLAELFKMEILISRSVRKYSNKVAN